MHQIALERLVAYLREKVPMARRFDIRPGRVDGTGLVLEAPLASNFNDKKTAFAGTLATLCPCPVGQWPHSSDAGIIHKPSSQAMCGMRPCSEQMIRHTRMARTEETAQFIDFSRTEQGVVSLYANAVQ